MSGSLPQPFVSQSTGQTSAFEKEKTEHDTNSKELERKTMLYVDWRIIPILGAVYSVAVVDRLNLGSAYTAGMGVDLALDQGSRFNLVICLFFIPYTILQLPGNLVLRRFGVRNLVTSLVFAWGALQIGMGFVSAWYWLIVCRILLGVFEASLFPSMLFILTTWYKRHEVQTRLAYFFVIAVFAAGLSPIFAYVCSLLGGRGNLAGWRWILIIEGLITLTFGILTWCFIPDFPDQNKFLTAQQTTLVLKRIDEDRGDAIPDEVTAQKIRKHLLDWTLWAYGLLFLCSAVPAYSQAYFLPIILYEMGWSDTQALLLSSAPNGMAVIAVVVAYLADRYKHRAISIAFSVTVCMVGIVLLAFAKATSVRYFGSFLITAGNAACLPAVLAYAANNVVSHSKRSVQTALQISLGGIGAIVGTVSYRAQDAPRYIPGLVTTLASQGLLLLVLLVTTIHLFWQNRLMRSSAREKPLEGQVGFYYTL